VNADPIRAVLLQERCLILVPDEQDELHIGRMMRKRLEECADDASYSFEFKCMEALLMTMFSHIEAEWSQLEPDVLEALADLLESQMQLEKLRQVKNRVATFDVQVGGLRQGLMELLNHDDDLQEMRDFCADRAFSMSMVDADETDLEIQDVEVLMEAYMREIHNMQSKVKLLDRQIDHTEELVEMRLDAARNRILKANLTLSLASASLSVAMVLTGAFGMNLKSGWEEDDHKFWGVGAFSVALCSALFVGGYIFICGHGFDGVGNIDI
jgi:magnesium transporter